MITMRITPLTLAGCLLLSGTLLADEKSLAGGDVISIDIKGVPADERAQVGGQYVVSDEGNIQLYLIGETLAMGEKPSTLAAKIEHAYIQQGYYTKPTIVVNTVVKEASDASVTIIGGVRRTGVVPYRPGLTLIDVVSASGGFNQFARIKEVRLTREGRTIVHNCDAMLKEPSKNVAVEPGDKIVVPEWGKRF